MRLWVGEGGFEKDSSESRGPMLIERSGFQFLLDSVGILRSPSQGGEWISRERVAQYKDLEEAGWVGEGGGGDGVVVGIWVYLSSPTGWGFMENGRK